MSRMQVFRLARGGKIPGARRTKGGQFYFTECEPLGEWICSTRARHLISRYKPAPQKYDGTQRDNPRLVYGLKFADDLVWWLKKRPAGFWTAERCDAWFRLLEPVAQIREALRSLPRRNRSA